MKHALISPNETAWTYTWDQGKQVTVEIPNSYRVAEVSDVAFEVAPPLFWVDCADNVAADLWYYDSLTQQIVEVIYPPYVPPVIEPDAQTTGTGGPDIVA